MATLAKKLDLSSVFNTKTAVLNRTVGHYYNFQIFKSCMTLQFYRTEGKTKRRRVGGGVYGKFDKRL